MSTIYRSPKAHLFSDPRGFVEVVFAEHAKVDQEELLKMVQAVASLNQPEVRFLINRLNEYGPPENFNVADFVDEETFRVVKVAYYAPSPGDQALSHLVGQTAFRKTTYQVFTDREQAAEWLLRDEVP